MIGAQGVVQSGVLPTVPPGMLRLARLLAADAACQDHPAFAAAAPESMPDYTSDEPRWKQT